MIERPAVTGNFTEWGIGGGGSLIFLASIARLRNATAAGFDAWDTLKDTTKHQRFAESAKKCGLSVPDDVEYYNLSSPSALAWPKSGSKEKLAFSHVNSNDYDTTMEVLKTVYPMTE